MDDHAEWIERGFCPETFEGRWCRLWVDHEGQHVAPWEYEFPRQESMVRWDDGPVNVDWLTWRNKDGEQAV